MFEVGMSALVLKICSEYAKSLGFNFPPCTQQEINAICEWVDKHTIKDMTISQNGFDVTFTFKTENDTTKEFTFTIPKVIDINELEKVLKGSDSIVVDRLEDNSGLQVRISQSVLNDINSKLAKPANPASESVVTMTADGTVGTKPLSGFTKVYRYDIELQYNTVGGETWLCDIYIYDTEEIETFTIDMLKSRLPNTTDGVLKNIVGWGFFGVFYYKINKLQFHGNAIDNEVTPGGQEYYLEIDVDACTIRRVTKTEL